MAKSSPKPVGQDLSEMIWKTGWTYIRHVVDTAREPFLILDKKLVVMAANEAFYRVFDVTETQTEGKFVFKLGDGQWAGKHLRKLLEDILPKETFFRDFEVDYEFPVVGRKVILLNARQVFSDDASLPSLIILAMEDVSKQRLIETKLLEYAKELEKKVIERTEQLTIRIDQLERMQAVTMDRELKMVELKDEIKDLKKLLISKK